MNILFTGASSFTGYWFAWELSQRGYHITAPLLRARGAYEGIRRQRVDLLSDFAEVVDLCSFGSASFLDLVGSRKWDVLCHHAADVANYKSPQFDYIQAVQRNTFRIEEVLKRLKPSKCKVVLTGSVFEQGEGVSAEPLRAVSPYGLSKGFTSAIFEYYCSLHEIDFQKFVIPNPFGPLEEERFTTYLVKQWFSGKTPELQSPGYVRDNIPVTLLSKAYADALQKSLRRFNPGYQPSAMEQFAVKFANEIQKRLQIPCSFTCKSNPEYSEPLVRTNSDLLSPRDLGWNEEQFWDQLAHFYHQTYRSGVRA